MSRKAIQAALASGLVIGLLASCGPRLPQSRIEAAASGSAGVTAGSAGTGSALGSAEAGGLGSSVGSSTGSSSGPVSGGATGITPAASGGVVGSSGTPGAATQPGSSGSPGPSASGASTGAGGNAATGGSTATGASGGGAKAASGPEALGITSCTPATGSPVNIGNTGTYSGVIGAVFSPALTGLQLWVQAANKCGGLNGHPIHLFTADDQGDPSIALTETEQQVQTDHVIAEVSDFSPFSPPTVLPYLEQQKVPEIGGCNCAPQDLWWGSGDIFPAGAGWNPYGGAPATLAHAAGHDKIAIFYCVEVPSQCGTLASNSAAQAQKLGMTVVKDEGISLTAPSFAAQCQEAKSAGAAAVLLYVDGGSIQRFADDCATSLNYKPAYYTVGLAITPQVVADPNLEGLSAPSQTFPWSYGGTPASAAYQRAIKTYDPSFSSAGPAAASWASGVLAQLGSADLSASNPTSAQFIQGLQSLKNESVGGLVSPASYGPNGATPPTCVYLNQIVNGKWTAPDGIRLLC